MMNETAMILTNKEIETEKDHAVTSIEFFKGKLWEAIGKFNPNEKHGPITPLTLVDLVRNPNTGQVRRQAQAWGVSNEILAIAQAMRCMMDFNMALGSIWNSRISDDPSEPMIDKE